MFAGPIITREVLTAPRPLRYFLWRASFACFLFILLWTAWQSIIGWQEVREVGVLARFGAVLYWLFAMLQLTLMLFFAPLFTAAAVSYEKDRRTFTLLLMTDLSDLEIVLGLEELAQPPPHYFVVVEDEDPYRHSCLLTGLKPTIRPGRAGAPARRSLSSGAPLRRDLGKPNCEPWSQARR